MYLDMHEQFSQQDTCLVLCCEDRDLGSGPGAAVPGSSGVGTPRQFTRQRITRVNLRDLIFCLENERETSHSLLLYKAFLK
ncbi:hypothetical protein U0070_000570 [Myodes glareolus]|uniref:Transcription initiation factor TFIID component TAF4 C-terminal domain-containing protein n=1 Tax=Myodes glareolus TaxID=447135 RepID=A0AAW0IIZ7_MYOGA